MLLRTPSQKRDQAFDYAFPRWRSSSWLPKLSWPSCNNGAANSTIGVFNTGHPAPPSRRCRQTYL